ncbi:MAG: competence/damage-inducible protein A [Gemmatimonadaceae bacterium]
MDIEIVTIGDELLLGFTVDTNAAHLARELAAIGVRITRRTTVGDAPAEIADAVRAGLDRAGAVITTGGLGPTSDDRTKPSIAALFGRGMHVDEEHAEWMRARWRARWGQEMPAANLQQASIPDGARTLANNHGSAPGIWLEDDRGRWVAMLPGVPSEMRGMLAESLLPILRERVEGAVVRSLTLRTTGVAESLLADRVKPVDESLGEVQLAYLPGVEGVDLRLTMRAPSAAHADAALGAAAARLRAILGADVYAEGATDLAAVVLDACRTRGLTIALAESCTGGMLGARLTAISGSSDVVVGGVIAYDDAVKRDLLGVDEALLRAYGAVSEPVVRAMASGARARTGARVGVGITGVAGPTGGTPEKPVGTVWIATDVDGVVEARLFRLWGSREEVRQRSAQRAMDLTRRRLLDSAHD